MDRSDPTSPSEVGPLPRTGRSRVGIALAAVAVGSAALGVTSIASATTNSATTNPTATSTVAAASGTASPSATPPAAGSTDAPPPPPLGPDGDGPRHGHGGRGFGGGPGMLGMGGALHGEFVVQKADGTYQTVDSQRGAVTAVTSSSISVKSADGFAKTYAVGADTIVNAARDGIGSVKVGDEVHIDATVSGGTATAVDVMDITTLKASGARWFGKEEAPAPTSSATPNA